MMETCSYCKKAEAKWDGLCDDCDKYNRCRRCGEPSDQVEDRYSFGVYAGRMCVACCSSYRDNCGIGQPQGNPADLDEQYDEEETAVYTEGPPPYDAATATGMYDHDDTN